MLSRFWLKHLQVCNSNQLSDRPDIQKLTYYPFLRQLLEKKGRADGWHRQLIRVDCLHCWGTGEVGAIFTGYEEVSYVSCKCCEGTGERVLEYYLQKYQIGQYWFLVPDLQINMFGRQLDDIEGRVHHSALEGRPVLSLALLLLRFDVPRFWKCFILTPLLSRATKLYRACMGWPKTLSMTVHDRDLDDFLL